MAPKPPDSDALVLTPDDDTSSLYTSVEQCRPAGPLGSSEIAFPAGVTIAADRLTGRLLAATIDEADDLVERRFAASPVRLGLDDGRWTLSYRDDLVDTPAAHVRNAAITLDLAFADTALPVEIRQIAAVEGLSQLFLATPPAGVAHLQHAFWSQLAAVREGFENGFRAPRGWRSYWPQRDELERLALLASFVIDDPGDRIVDIEHWLLQDGAVRAPARGGQSLGTTGGPEAGDRPLRDPDSGVEILVGGTEPVAVVWDAPSELIGRPALFALEDAGGRVTAAGFISYLKLNVGFPLHGSLPVPTHGLRTVCVQSDGLLDWQHLAVADRRQRDAARAWLTERSGIGPIWSAAEQSIRLGRYDQALAALELGAALRPHDRTWDGVAKDMRNAISGAAHDAAIGVSTRYGDEWAFELSAVDDLTPPRFRWAALVAGMVVAGAGSYA